MNETGTGAWLVVSVSTAGGAASLRVLAWRKLRSLGALYLQQSVCLLPATADVARDVRRLAGRVRQGGGTARVLPVAFTGPAAEQAVITGLDAARDAEYAEVPGRLPGLHRELAREQARGRAADAGAGESGAGLDRFRAWLAKIGARDYFGAAGGAAAAALAASGNAAPDAGTSGPAPATGPGQPRLRAAGGP